MSRIWGILVGIWMGFCVYAQDVNPKTADYSYIDSLAKAFPKKKYKAVSEITYPLTERILTEHEKFRIIFRWITENIEYNKTAANLSQTTMVLKKNKAVCQGFANLLKEMCNSVNIPCEVVEGYTKTEIKDINKKLKKTDHAWNVVTLYGKRYLVDVTWATSKLNAVTGRFIKEFDEHYYLTPPELFVMDHFPKDMQYQLLGKPVKEKDFISTPLYYPDFFHFTIRDLKPEKGKFSLKCGDSIQFSMRIQEPVEHLAVMASGEKAAYKVDYTVKDGVYSFYYVFDRVQKYDIVIYLNGKCILEYYLSVKESNWCKKK